MATEIGQTVLTTHRVLANLGVESAMMGELALSAWQHRRATDDIDLLIGAAVADSDSLLQSMQAHGYQPARLPAVTDFDGEHVMQLDYQPPGKSYEFRVDLFYAESQHHRTALARRTSFTLPDGEQLPVVSCEDLILFKLQADRLIDRMDVVALLKHNRGDLDFGLTRWLTAANVRLRWAECWREAFPGEPDPVTGGS
jgi:hypothetical protein